MDTNKKDSERDPSLSKAGRFEVDSETGLLKEINLNAETSSPEEERPTSKAGAFEFDSAGNVKEIKIGNTTPNGSSEEGANETIHWEKGSLGYDIVRKNVGEGNVESRVASSVSAEVPKEKGLNIEQYRTAEALIRTITPKEGALKLTREEVERGIQEIMRKQASDAEKARIREMMEPLFTAWDKAKEIARSLRP